MTVVRVLAARTYKAHSFTYPLRSFRESLEDVGLRVHVEHQISPRLFEADVVCLTTEAFVSRRLNRRPPAKETFLPLARERARTLIWFDTSASTGGTSFQVLPYVDLYAKNQLLRDRLQYTRHRYADRVYAEYYHVTRGVRETRDIPVRQPATADQLHKLVVSWNLGLGDFTTFSPLRRRLRILWGRPGYRDRFHRARFPRSLDVSLRASTRYGLETVSYHRRETARRLESYGRAPERTVAQDGRLGHRSYLSELRRARVVPSPFGLGEVCLRDFECFLAGGALLKPDLAHMETWPDYYEPGVTYRPHQWDFSDFSDALDALLDQPEKRRALARAGQDRFLASRSAEGGRRFAERFRHIIRLARAGHREAWPDAPIFRNGDARSGPRALATGLRRGSG